MTDLLDEVQEDLKEEKYSRIVSKLSRIFLTVAAVALVFTAVHVRNDSNNKNLQNSLGVLFNKAMISVERKDFDEAIVYFDQVIEHPKQQYAALASLQKSAILMKQNKHQQAQEELLKMSKNKDFDLVFRELAQVIFLGNKLQIGDVEDNSASEMLKDLTASGHTWQLSALQLKALYDLKQNKVEDAKTTLDKIIHSEQASKYSQDTASSILSVISRK